MMNLIAYRDLTQGDRKGGIVVSLFLLLELQVLLYKAAWDRQALQDSETEFSTDDKSRMDRF